MSSQRPDPKAEIRAFVALILDDARRNPERRPRVQVLRWFSELSCAIGVVPQTPDTYKELLAALLRLHGSLSAAPAAAPAAA
jgi:hypothetical protein